MRDYTAESARLRALCSDLLQKGAVDLILAWTSGPGLTAREAIIAKGSKETERIVWSPFCTSSTATLFKRNRANLQGKKLGFVVKDCDLRALNVLMQEYLIKRENVVLIGVRCDGLADAGQFPGASSAAKVSSDARGVQVDGKSAPWEQFGYTACQSCSYDNMNADHIVGEYGRKKSAGEWEHVARLQGLPPHKRREHFEELFSKCIRCYACREVCPVCACIECAIDPGERCITPRTTPLEKISAPNWACRGRQLTENAVYLLTRSMHMAGRCVRCGWCERACPVGLPLMDLLDMVNANVLSVYKYETGLDISSPPFLAKFSDEDPNDKGGGHQ